jgi:hypothetical protein
MDILRARDYMANSNVVLQWGDEHRRVADLIEGTRIGLPYALWHLRLAYVYQIVDFKNENMVGTPQWATMRKCAVSRGIMLGALIDHASQVTVGSIRNLARMNNARSVVVPFLLATHFATNFAYSKDPKLLGIRYLWFGRTKADTDVGDDSEEILSRGIQPGVPTPVERGTGDGSDLNDPIGDPDAWWIETRMTWESVLSPDITYPIRTEIVPFTRNKIVRVGQQIMTQKTDRATMDRYMSLGLVTNGNYRYTHHEFGTVQSRVVMWTNSRLPSHHVYWHSALDDMIGVYLSGDMTRVEIMDANISVRQDTRPDLGNFEGMDMFAGLGDF